MIFRLCLVAAVLATGAHAALAETAQTPRACDAAWLPAALPVSLMPLEAGAYALVAGEQVLARIDATSVAGLRREGERVQGIVAIDTECQVKIDAHVVKKAAAAAVRRAAAALDLLQRARAAAAAADVDRAADLSEQALAALGEPSREHAALRVTLAAYAAERARDALRTSRAHTLVEATRAAAGALAPGHPAALRFELARARNLDYPAELELRERLQPLLIATFGADTLPTYENGVRKANALLALDRTDEALASLADLEGKIAARVGPAHPLRLLATRAAANALALALRYDEQVARLQELARTLSALYGADDRRVVDTDLQIARGLADAFRFQPALAAAARVYLWRQRELGAAHPQTLEVAQLIGLLFGLTGRYASARAVLADVLLQLGADGDKNLVARAQRDLATWTARDGAPDSALGLMRAAYDTTLQVFSAQSRFSLGVAVDYGWLLLWAGRYSAALDVLQPAHERLSLRNEMGELAAVGLARCWLEMADASRHEAARALLRAAREFAVQRAGPAHQRALLWQAMLAGAELRTGERTVAKQLLVDFVAQAEKNRLAAAGDPALRDSIFALWVAESDSIAGYRTLAWMHARDGELEAALRVAELARDRRLRDRFEARAGAVDAQLQELDERLALAESVPERIALESRRMLLEQDRARPMREARSTPAAAALRARIPPRTALVSIQRAQDRWWAIVLASDTQPRLLMLEREPGLDVAARAWSRLLRGEPARAWPVAGGSLQLSWERPSNATGPWLREPALARHLSAALLAPVLAVAPQTRRLVISGDDALLGVPFEALPTGNQSANQRAVQRLDISYVPSLSTWMELQGGRRARAWSHDVLAVGGIDYTRTEADRFHSALMPVALRGAWAPLPHARAELESIARIFPPARVRSLINGEVAKTPLIAQSRAGELARYRYVHFATHAFVEPEFAERSSLVFAPPTAPPTEAFLTATELAGLSMASDLVVLSACDTGTGRFEHGQGLLGFAFAVLAAGNRAALLSLWPVADDTTARFMARFYSRLRAGRQPAAALAETKREFLRSSDPRLRDPRAWAGFVLYGGG